MRGVFCKSSCPSFEYPENVLSKKKIKKSVFTAGLGCCQTFLHFHMHTTAYTLSQVTKTCLAEGLSQCA